MDTNIPIQTAELYCPPLTEVAEGESCIHNDNTNNSVFMYPDNRLQTSHVGGVFASESVTVELAILLEEMEGFVSGNARV